MLSFTTKVYNIISTIPTNVPPTLNIPAVKASPTGKTSSHANSTVRGNIAIVKIPKILIPIKSQLSFPIKQAAITIIKEITCPNEQISMVNL